MSQRASTVRTVRKVTADPEVGFFPFLWRHRVGLAPVLFGFVVYVVELVLRYIVNLDITKFAISVVIGSLVAGAFIRWTTSDREARWHARRNQNYLYVVTLCVGAWGVWFQGLPHTGPEVWKLGSTVFGWAALVLALPYWFDLRRRTRVMLDNKIDAWPALTETTRFAGSKLAGWREKEFGWKVRLYTVPGKNGSREVANSTEMFEQLLDEPPGSITVDVVKGKSNTYELTCVNNDPHVAPIEWDATGVRSIMDYVTIGKYADHKDEDTAWWRPGVGGFHRMIAGLTRSGKSGLMHLLVGIYAQASDVVFWFADLKDGTALLPWSPLADWTTTTQEDALMMVRGAREVVGARSRKLARAGKEVWEPSPHEPVLILVMDEIAELLGDSAPRKIATEAGKALVTIARKGAGVGVLMVLATQYPTLEALKSSQLRSQLSWAACFRCRKQMDAQFILPQAAESKIDVSAIPAERQGTCYVDAEGDMRMAPLRILYLAHERIKGLVIRLFGSRPGLDEASLKWKDAEVYEAYQARTRWTPTMLEQMRAGELSGYSPDDLLDEEEDDALFALDEEEVATNGAATNGAAILPMRGHTAKPAATPVASTEDDGQQPEVKVPMSWFTTTELGRAAMARMMGPHAMADRKAREAWLSEHKARELPEARLLFEQELDRAQVDDETRTVAELARTSGRNQRTIYRWLEEMRNAGEVERIENGRYRRVTSVNVTDRN